MKQIILILLSAVLYFGCVENDFELDNPNPKQFVQQLKSGTYNQYELGENQEKLWTKMPNFRKEHIPELIELANDTSMICPSEHFPINPISSVPAYRIHEGNSCIMLGEYLLWCVEGIIQGKKFASLVPVLVNIEKNEQERLSGKKVLEVRELYQYWWNKFGKTGDTSKPPLEKTVYRW